MFNSERYPVTIPQREHARFAGLLAYYWGNQNFQLPLIGREALVKGISFHHTGYPEFDTVVFRELSEEELISVFERDISVDLGDTDAELVNLFHQLRLINNRLVQQPSNNFEKVRNIIEADIESKLEKSQYSREDFVWANRITHLCDRISFNFCFGSVVEPEIEVYSETNNTETIIIKHRLGDEGVIHIDPWPFSVQNIRGFIHSYQAEYYPNELIPYILSYEVKPDQI